MFLLWGLFVAGTYCYKFRTPDLSQTALSQFSIVHQQAESEGLNMNNPQ
jgi:hypothetical protein